MEVSRGRSTASLHATDDGKGRISLRSSLTNHHREEPSVLSDRPTPQQLTFDFDDFVEADDAAPVKEPQRGQSVSATTEQPSLDQFSGPLMEKIVEQANMERAWKNVRSNAGAPGPDGITVDEFPEWFRPRWPETRQQLLEGTYRPAAARRKCIPKPDGSERLLALCSLEKGQTCLIV